MKLKNILLMSIAALLAAACISNENFQIEEIQSGPIKNIRVTAQDFKWANSPTKSLVEVGNDGVKFKWAENDTIGIFPSNGYQVPFPMNQGAGTNSAQFDGGDWKLRESALYVAYYPFDFYNKSGKNIAVSYLGQVQQGNDNTGHIGKYDYLFASARTPQNGTATFNFNHLGALLRFKLKIKNPSELTALTIETDEPLFIRKGSVNIISGSPEIASEEKFTRLSMELSNVSTETPDEEITIYMMTAPADLSGKTLFVYLSGKDGKILSYEIEGKNFEAGKAYSLSGSDGNYEDPHIEIADYKGKAIGYEGGIVSVEYLSNLECEYIIGESALSWISSNDSKALTSRKGSFTIKENAGRSNRMGTITVKGKNSNLAIEYTVIQGFKGAHAIVQEGGFLPIGILYSNLPATDSEHGVDKMVDNDLNTYFQVKGSNFDIIWEGPYQIGISQVEIGRSANENEIKDITFYCSDSPQDWGNWIMKTGSFNYSGSKRISKHNLHFHRARCFRFNITENFGAATTMVPEFRFSEDKSMDRDIHTFQDLMEKGQRVTNSSKTPMGKNYENRHITTPEDIKWLLNPDNEPSLLGSAPQYTYRKFTVNLYPFGTPQPADVNQRGIGDCCAMAVFAEMAYMFPDFIKSIIKDHGDGTYTVKMFDPQGQPVDVRIKNTFLCDENGLGATAGKDGNANWATIMEKAIMKWNFIYKVNPDISGIATENVVPLFTGNGNSFAILPNQFTAQNLDKAVDLALENNMIVVGGFNKKGLSVGGPQTHTLHAYSFMYSTKSEALFAVRNPWGHNNGEEKGADGVMHVVDDGIVPPTIDIRVVYPGAAEKYAIRNLGPYVPPTFETKAIYNHAKGILERIK